MIRKILWMMILLLMTACTILFSEGGEIVIGDQTPTLISCEGCTPLPTDIPLVTETTSPTVEISPTAVFTATAVPTQTLVPTSTVVPTLTNTSVPATATKTAIPPTATKTDVPPTTTKTAVPPTATKTSEPTPTKTNTAMPDAYIVQPTTPVFMQNFVHTVEGCTWQGVAGQVFDTSGKPVTNLIIKIYGTWDGASVSKVGITGMVTGLPYGPGSYEIVLGNKALDTIDQLFIQVFSASQTPLTTPLAFSTSSDCNKNLVMINFKAK